MVKEILEIYGGDIPPSYSDAIEENSVNIESNEDENEKINQYESNEHKNGKINQYESND